MGDLAGTSVLLIGCGGIGCEIAKQLAVVELRAVHLIDLDTIELSNLNRQFIFKPRDIGHGKAACLARWLQKQHTARGFGTRITHSQESILGAAFSPSFVARFDVAINALDNACARSHANRMRFLAAAVRRPVRTHAAPGLGEFLVGARGQGAPLVDAGTAGLRGNVAAYFAPGPAVPCFDCFPPPPPRSLPVCTVRTLPTSPEHCMAFALMAFRRAFCAPAAAHGAGDLADVPRVQLPAACDAAALLGAVCALFNAVCVQSVQMALVAKSARGLWERRPEPPAALAPRDVPALLGAGDTADALDAAFDEALDEARAQMADPAPLRVDTATRFFLGAAAHLARQCDLADFSRDDAASTVFVVALCALRCAAFHLRPPSLFHGRSLAERIVPAVATTNAAVAALAFLEARAVATGAAREPGEVYASPTGKPLFRLAGTAPNPDCPTCRGAPVVFRPAGPPEGTPLAAFCTALLAALGRGADESVSLFHGQRLLFSNEAELESDQDAWGSASDSDPASEPGGSGADGMFGAQVGAGTVLLALCGDAPVVVCVDAE